MFSKNGTVIGRDELPLFLKSIGLNKFKFDIEDSIKAKAFTDVNEKQLREIIIEILQLKDPAYINESSREWPSDTDVMKAFSVFDQDGNGYIPVQQLKRFLLQAKLDIQEEELEKLIRDNCKIDNDDQVDYEEFVKNIRCNFSKLLTIPHEI